MAQRSPRYPGAIHWPAPDPHWPPPGGPLGYEHDPRNSAEPYPAAPPAGACGYAETAPGMAWAESDGYPPAESFYGPPGYEVVDSPAADWGDLPAEPEFEPEPEPYEAAAPERILAGFLLDRSGSNAFWPLYRGENVIGRGGRRNVLDVALHNPTVSSHHLMIWVGPDDRLVRDLGSTNGSLLNGLPIGYRGEQRLMDGDLVECGAVALLFVDVAARVARAERVWP